MFPVKRTIAAVVVVIVAALYFTGRLDYLLYPMHLNFHTCARNGFGATFCGSDLTAYENHIRSVQRQLRGLAVHPIQPLPGATPAEQQSYQQAMQSYCQANPQGQGCP